MTLGDARVGTNFPTLLLGKTTKFVERVLRSNWKRLQFGKYIAVARSIKTYNKDYSIQDYGKMHFLKIVNDCFPYKPKWMWQSCDKCATEIKPIKVLSIATWNVSMNGNLQHNRTLQKLKPPCLTVHPSMN